MTKKTAKPRGLGKGLDALLMDEPEETSALQSRLVPVASITPNPYQPRTIFREEELAALVASVRREGVLTPVLLRPHGEQGWQLIAGERRWRAAQAAGLDEIPAVVRDVSDAQALELAIIENEQRDNLSAIESARAYQRLMEEFAYTQQKVATQLGVSRSHVSNTLRLLRLPEKVQQLVATRQLEMGHVRPLVGMEPARAEALAQEALQQQWSARRVEQEAKRSQQKQPSGDVIADADILALEDELCRALSLKVHIRHKKNGGGEIRIQYGYAGELDQLLKRLRQQA